MIRKKLWKIPIPIAIAIIIALFAGGGALIYALTKTTEKAGPVGYWKFDEGAGTVAYDASGNANNGTLTNFDFNDNSNWTTGKVAGALEFDGSNDYVDAGTGASLDMGTGDATVEMWIKLASISRNHGLIRTRTDGDSDAGISWYYLSALNKIYFRFCDGSTTRLEHSSSAFTITDTNWHLITVTYDRDGNATYYLDGISKFALAISTQQGNITNSASLRLGYGTTYYQNGLIDEVRVYNRALSAAEISWNYNRRGPVGWWPFDEGSGQEVHDRSGNDNHGDWNGTGDHWAEGN